MLCRYGNIDYILALDVASGIALIAKARERERDERFYRQWLAQLPFMGEDNFIAFDEYRDRLTGANIDTRPTAVILAEMEAVEKEFRKEETNGT